MNQFNIMLNYLVLNAKKPEVFNFEPTRTGITEDAFLERKIKEGELFYAYFYKESLASKETYLTSM